jgi:hypothetical protein
MKTAVLIHLSHGMWKKKDADIYESFEEEAWEAILPLLNEYGVDTILLDVGDAVEYKSHPEISIKNAWSRERVK